MQFLHSHKVDLDSEKLNMYLCFSVAVAMFVQ